MIRGALVALENGFPQWLLIGNHSIPSLALLVKGRERWRAPYSTILAFEENSLGPGLARVRKVL